MNTTGGRQDRRVSGRALLPLHTAVLRYDLDPDELLQGTGLSPAQLERPSGRVSWDLFALITDRVRTQVGPGAMRELGRGLQDQPGIGVISRMASMVASPAAMYAAAPRLGLATLFPMVEGRHEFVSAMVSRIEASIPAGYAPSRGFFEITAGNFEALPVLLGQPQAVVRLQTDGRRATYEIEHGVSQTLWSRIRSMWRILFSGRSLLNEITERNTELARQLAESAASRARADRAVAVQNDLLTAVSHELRTPIGQVQGLVELALDERDRDEAEAHLRSALQATSRLTRTVDMLIHVAALGEAADGPKLAPVDLGPFVRGVIEDFERIGIDRIVRVPAAGEARVAVAPDGLRTVVRELVSNAFHFTQSGSVTVEAEVRDSDDRLELWLVVRDTGIGLEPEWVERVFEPFVQRDRGLARRAQGVGLGLTVTRSLAQRLGGRVHLESVLGEGTTVTVVLPVSEVDAEVTCAGPELARSLATPLPSKSAQPAPHEGVEHLVVVDDNAVNRMLLTSIGRRLGFRVTAVDSGEAALDVLTSQPCDLVFMDVQMPGLDGLQTTERLRASPLTCDLPIIAVTAQAAPGDEARCRRAGMDAYVPKPVEMQRLREAIDEARAARSGKATARRASEGQR